MKKALAVLFIFGFYYSSQAQLRKGRMVVGLNFNFQQFKNSAHDTSFSASPGVKSVNEQSYKEKMLNVGLNFGYFVSRHVVVGLSGSYQNSYYYSTYSNTYVTTSLSSNIQKQNTYYAGVYSRYYQMLGTSKLAIFGEVRGSYIWGNATEHNASFPGTVSVTDTKNATTGFSFGFRPGITYFLNDRFALESTFGNVAYSINNVKTKTDGKASGNQKNTTINANFGFNSLYIGLSYYFGGKKQATPEPAK